MVYLVDDDIDDLEFVQEALFSNSYKGPVDTAQNGRELLDRLSDDVVAKPDVIVLDLNMPLIDGFQALHYIKTHPSFHKIPVIVLTASSSKEDEMRCLALGCSSYFTKPSRIEEYGRLVTVIKGFLHIRGSIL
jgi:CheY-like chemotaxis protein